MTAHSLTNPQFYLTAPAPCPYIEGNVERKVFTHLVGENATQLHDELTRGGFRRSQNIAYRPACESCRACTATRVLADRFSPSKSMRRIADRNADLIGVIVPNTVSAEQYALFRRYIASRHGNGGMAQMTILDYVTMVEDSHVNTGIIEYRKSGPDTSITGKGVGDLIAVVLFDRLSTGLSMVYSFFEPEEEKRSLGTFLILDHIKQTRRSGLPHCHLGFWVEGSRKMEYKSRFQPQERLEASGWIEADE
ncbi:MAG: arginyltransferase [Rhizobiaceae bacterium]